MGGSAPSLTIIGPKKNVSDRRDESNEGAGVGHYPARSSPDGRLWRPKFSDAEARNTVWGPRFTRRSVIRALITPMIHCSGLFNEPRASL